MCSNITSENNKIIFPPLLSFYVFFFVSYCMAYNHQQCWKERVICRYLVPISEGNFSLQNVSYIELPNLKEKFSANMKCDICFKLFADIFTWLRKILLVIFCSFPVNILSPFVNTVKYVTSASNVKPYFPF